MTDHDQLTHELEIETETRFDIRFPDEDACREFFKLAKWPNGFVCPKCGNTDGRKILTRKQYYCTQCPHHESLTAHTVLEHTKLPFRTWFRAIFYEQHGVTGYRLAQLLEIAESTAWHLLHRIRKGMKTRDRVVSGVRRVLKRSEPVPFSDAMNNRAWRTAGRPNEPLVSLDTEDGTLALKVLDMPEAAAELAADPVTSSPTRSDASDEPHQTPSADSKRITTTAVKSWLRGLYRGTVGRHLQRYLDEFCFRRNCRDEQPRFFALILEGCLRAKPLRRRELSDYQSWLARHRVGARPPLEAGAGPCPAGVWMERRVLVV